MSPQNLNKKKNMDLIKKFSFSLDVDHRQLTLTQIKVWGILMDYALKSSGYDFLKQDNFIIKKKFLYELLGWGKETDAFLAEEIEKLINIVVKWNRTSRDKNVEGYVKKKKSLGASAFLGSFNFINNNEDIEFSFPYHLREIVTQAEFYFLMKREIFLNMKKRPTLILWQYCLDYSYGKRRETKWFTPEDLLLAFGKEKNKSYSNSYGTFKAMVIKPAIKEVNKLTNLKVIIDEKKFPKKNKIEKVRFLIEENSTGTINKIAESESYIEVAKSSNVYNVVEILKLKAKEMENAVTSVIPNGRFFVTKIFSYAVQEIGFYEDIISFAKQISENRAIQNKDGSVSVMPSFSKTFK